MTHFSISFIVTHLAAASTFFLMACGSPKPLHTPKEMADSNDSPGVLLFSTQSQVGIPGEVDSCLFLAEIRSSSSASKVFAIVPLIEKSIHQENINGFEAEFSMAVSSEGVVGNADLLEDIAAELQERVRQGEIGERDCVAESVKLKMQFDRRSKIVELTKNSSDANQSDSSASLGFYSASSAYNYDSLGPTWGYGNGYGWYGGSNSIASDFYNSYYSNYSNVQLAGFVGNAYSGASMANTAAEGCGGNTGVRCAVGAASSVIQGEVVNRALTRGGTWIAPLVGVRAVPLGAAWEIFSQGANGSLLNNALKYVPGMYGACNRYPAPSYCNDRPQW